MRVVSKVDEQGFYVEDRLLEDGERTPAGCIENRPPEGLHRPKWNGSSGAWVEGKPESEIVEALKESKVNELTAKAVEDLSPLFTDGQGRDELVFVLVGHVKRICEALGVQADSRLAAVEMVGNKALAKRDEVEAATSAEEVEAVVWERAA